MTFTHIYNYKEAMRSVLLSMMLYNEVLSRSARIPRKDFLTRGNFGYNLVWMLIHPVSEFLLFVDRII